MEVLREAPATVGQKLLWMMDHYRSSTEHGVFSCPLVLRVRGRLDRAALQSALDGLEHRHEALRTVLTGRGRAVRQQVLEPAGIPVAWSDAPGADADATVDAGVDAELRCRIDPAGRPVRARAWALGDTRSVVCLNVHHVATDAWSTGILFRELLRSYARGGDTGALPPVPLQYPDFALWQLQQVESGALQRSRDYWLAQLEGSRLALPERVPGAPQSPTGPTATVAAELGAPTVAALRRLAADRDLSLFALLLSAWLRVLAAHTGRDDVCTATLLANRAEPRTQATVGFCANMAVLRARDAGGGPLDVADAAGRTVREALAHQAHPFQLLPPSLVDCGGARPDDVVFQMVIDPGHRAHAGGTRVELQVPETIGSRFGLELVATEHGASVGLVLFHRCDWYPPELAQSLLASYRARIADLLDAAGAPSGDTGPLGAA